MQPCIIKRTKASRRTNPYNPYNPCNHYFVERRAHNRECVCMYVYLHVWMYVCVHEILHTYICVYVHVYVYAHAGKDEDEGVVLLTAYDARREEGLLLWLNAQVPLYSHMDICVCTCTHVYEYVCMYIYRYGYMDVCIFSRHLSDPSFPSSIALALSRTFSCTLFRISPSPSPAPRFTVSSLPPSLPLFRPGQDMKEIGRAYCGIPYAMGFHGQFLPRS